jgi:homoserine dehydrogenase
VTQLFSELNISIEAMMQNPDHDHDERVELLFITHETQEKHIQEAIQKLEALNVVHGNVAMIRIEQ